MSVKSQLCIKNHTQTEGRIWQSSSVSLKLLHLFTAAEVPINRTSVFEQFNCWKFCFIQVCISIKQAHIVESADVTSGRVLI